MAKRCPRKQVRGPDGNCYTKKQLRRLRASGAFSRARDREAEYELGAAETKCALPGSSQRVRVCVSRSGKPGRQLGGPLDVCSTLRSAKDADRESFYVLYLDSQNRINGIEEAHKGTAAAVEVHPREVFKGAIAANSTAVILAHNHPSGSDTPSLPDLALTERLVEAGNLIGIPVLDHVVVADFGCTSIREQNQHLFSGVESLSRRKKEE